MNDTVAIYSMRFIQNRGKKTIRIPSFTAYTEQISSLFAKVAINILIALTYDGR